MCEWAHFVFYNYCILQIAKGKLQQDITLASRLLAICIFVMIDLFEKKKYPNFIR